MIIERNNLCLLADELINEIRNRKDPFETYSIIVPNLLLEQWFKAYWIQKTNAVLLNVQFKRIRPFINEIFNTTKKELINAKLLSNLIIKELLCNIEEYSSFKKYIIKNDTINNINLYDLAKNLANIFISYDNEGFIPNNEQKKLLDNIKIKYNDYVFLSDIIKNNPIISKKAFVFGFRKIEKSYLIGLEKNNSIIYKQNSNEIKNILNYRSCLSKEREVEYIHGEICKILNNNEKVYNITVYSINLDEYIPIIKKVFSTGGNKNYPEVPYVILDSSNSDSNASSAIIILYNILNNKQFTRYDLLKLITNSNIQKARNIDISKINIIIEALDKMNVYRDSTMSDDWIYSMKRILLSKLIGENYNIENKIIIDNDTLLPFGSISLDNETIVTLLSIIEDIMEFRNKFQDKKIFNNNDLEELKIELNKWLLYSDEKPNFYFNAIINSIDNLINMNIDLPFEIVFLTMIDASKTITVYPSNMITGGVTFINYKEDNIISSKYMFFMGMSNNTMPRKNIIDELDLNDNKESLSNIDKEIYKLLTNNSIITYATYTNINLQTLEEYKPSLLLNKNEKEIPVLGLLERRKYSELFTKREIDKKDYAIGLIEDNTNNEDNEDIIYPKIEYPLSVKYKEISNYVKENLMSKMERLFKEYDDFSIISTKEYEPIFIDTLTKSNISKSLLFKMIEKNSSLIDEELNDVIKEFKLKHSYPYLDNKADLDEIISSTQKYYDDLGDFELKEPFEIELNTIIENNEYNWKLICNSNYIISTKDNNIIFNYAKVKLSNSYEDMAELYILALAHIVKYINDNDDYIININHKLNKYKEDKNYIISDFTINRIKAINILNNLYFNMFNYDDTRLRSFDVLEEDSFDSLINQTKNGAWRLFKDKDFINLKEKAGYGKNEYESIDKNNSLLRNELIDFITNNVLYVTENGGENNGE